MIKPYSNEEKQYIKNLVRKYGWEPFWKQRRFHYLLIIIVSILVISIVFITFPKDYNHYIPNSNLDEFGWSETKAINTAEKVIQEQLTFPSSAKFSNIKATLKSENVSFNEYEVTGNVESLNSYGITKKESFNVILMCFTDSYYELVE